MTFFDRFREGRWLLLIEVLVIIILYGIGFGMDGATPHDLPFAERDPALSYAYVPSTCPVWLLIVIGYGIPLIAILCTACVCGLRHDMGVKSSLQLTLWIVLGLNAAIAITLVATNTVKNAVGRHRPNFFAYCDYQGYRAIAAAGGITGNATLATNYISLTTAGAFGSRSLCQGDKRDIAESQRSFPSGHASTAFAGMMYLTLYLRWLFRVRKGTWVSGKALVSSLPLILAAWVAISRVWDRFHNYDDISIGAIIGAGAASMAWGHYRSHADSRDGLYGPQGVGEDSDEDEGEGSGNGNGDGVDKSSPILGNSARARARGQDKVRTGYLPAGVPEPSPIAVNGVYGTSPVLALRTSTPPSAAAPVLSPTATSSNPDTLP